MSRTTALLLALVVASAGLTQEAAPGGVRVAIFNNALVDLEVEVASHRFIEILHGKSAIVNFQSTQWINFGIVAHEFQLPVNVLDTLKAAPAQLQAEGDGKLYLVPAGLELPMCPLPPQPPGFPLTPTEMIDLT